jgi:hypothetical protein
MLYKLVYMKSDAHTLLNDQLAKLNCQRVPSWLQARLITLIKAEEAKIHKKAQQQLLRVVSRKFTTKMIAAEILNAPPPIEEVDIEEEVEETGK